MSGIIARHLKMSATLRDSKDSSERNLGNGHHPVSASPLKLFGQAKKKINDVFKNISEYVKDGEAFLNDISNIPALNTSTYVNVITSFHSKVDGIAEVLSRDHMKVAFFGRTSNGKSSTINAMLKDKILPSGIGHTTNCFLQVEGTDQSEAFILTEDSDEPQNMSNIKQLAHALSSYKLSSNSLIRILWPKHKCRLLKEDVILVDSPGIDVTPDLDLWIDKFCLDADVFVLVGNAESTLMQTEKNFFHKVSERLSKPNVFVLMNRWDMSAQEEDIEMVREQHLQRDIEFLVDELKVVDRSEAENRIFFVSAREAMLCRLHEDKGTPTPIGSLAEGFQGRLFEFANFESQFEACISKSAVKTKFEQHTVCGKSITSEARTIMDDVFSKTLVLKDEKYQEKRDKIDELDYTDKQMRLLSDEIKEKIRSLSEEVERKVSQSLREEITRLSLVIEEFNQPFTPDSHLLDSYKKELHAHVERGLDSNLQSRCSLTLTNAVHASQNEMTERLSSLLPDDARSQLTQHLPQRQFEVSYHLNCQNLCSDFTEDLSFRFSLGPVSLMKRFWTTPAYKIQPASHGNELKSRRSESDLLFSLIPTVASLTSRATVGSVVVTCLIAKTAGWRVIAVTGGLYGLVYLYERLTWTSRAKEREFKKQYTDYAASKLKLVVDLTSTNCGHQVKNELTTSFSQLVHQINVSKTKLEKEIENLEEETQRLTDVGNSAKILRNKADWLDGELNGFINQYLKDST